MQSNYPDTTMLNPFIDWLIWGLPEMFKQCDLAMISNTSKLMWDSCIITKYSGLPNCNQGRKERKLFQSTNLFQTSTQLTKSNYHASFRTVLPAKHKSSFIAALAIGNVLKLCRKRFKRNSHHLSLDVHSGRQNRF